MASISEKVDADLILVTPASNIGDFSPFKSEPSHHLSTHDISQVDSLKEAANAALEEEDYRRAEGIVREALAIDERDPELLYLHGQALRSLDRIDEARSAFIRSKDEDICPLRALSPVRKMVTDVARTKNTGFVDFASIVRESSPDGIPGSELFLDHVHPTIEGNRLLALSIIDEMIKEALVSPSSKWNEELIAEISLKLENRLDEKTHAIALRNLSKVLNWAGKHDEAERLTNLAVDMIPEDSEIHAQKGISLWKAGDRKAAIVEFREAVRLNPYNASTRRSLGIVLSELNRLDEALAELEEAIRLDPSLPFVHYDLGIVLQAQGKMMQAASAYRTAQKMDPDHAEACNNLGIILAQSGDFSGAYEQFARAVELDPDYGEAARNLERASRAMGQNQ